MTFIAGGSGTAVVSSTINQVAHGFVVGNWIYASGVSTYAKTNASSPVTSDAVGVVTTVTDANNFKFTSQGYVTGLTGLTPTSAHFISDVTAGAITATELTNIASTRKPVLIADTTTSGWVNIEIGTPVLGTTSVVQSGSTNGTNGATYSTSFTTIATIVIPTAGPYRISYNLGHIESVSNIVTTQVIDPSSAVIAQSIATNLYAPANVGNIQTVSNTFNLPSSAVAGTYILQAKNNGGTGTVQQNASASTNLSYEQTGTSPVPMSLVGEYGENNSIVVGQTVGSTTFTDVTGGSFVIPSAGLWQVEYFMFSYNGTAGNGTKYQITDAANVAVPFSNGHVETHSVNNGLAMSQSVFITTTAATTYKLRWGSTGASTSTLGSPTFDSPKITWKKISGFVPSSGQTVDYVYARYVATQSISTNSDFTGFVTASGNIPNSNGVFALTAGKVYDILVKVAGAGFSSSSVATYTLVDSVTNTPLYTFSGGSSTPPSVANAQDPQQVFGIIYIPTTNQSIKVRATSVNSTVTVFPYNAGSIGGTEITIKQLGSTSVIAGQYPGTWSTYIPTITAVTTNPTKGTTTIDSASYMIEGKKCTINYFYRQTSAGTAGSGTYKWSLPPGVVIDTAQLTTYSSQVVALLNNNMATPVGTSSVSNAPGSVAFIGLVFAADSTSLMAAQTQSSIGALTCTGSGNISMANTNLQFGFQAVIPIV